MKNRKIFLTASLLFILSIPACFLYMRLHLPIYKYDGNILVYKDNVYVARNSDTDADRYNLGKPIGIAKYSGNKVTLNDLIFGNMIFEYKDDKDHNHIFVHVFMDGSGAYDKVSK